ncbi:MAG: histidinol-phosphate transaminase [Chloroflexota bacterium]
METKARRLVRQDVIDLQPYTPVESPESLAERLGMPIDMILKLDSNENPYGCSILVQEALGAFDRYHHYPDAQARRVRERIGTYADANPDRIVIGNGSDELIDLILLVSLEPGDEVIIPTPTFGVYKARSELFGGRAVEIGRDANFDLDMPAILDAISERTKIIFVTAPNNPTGNPVSQQEMVQLLNTGALVIADEAYYEFSAKTFVPLTKEFDNLIVLRTFSKWAGIAGLRLGYGIFPEMIAAQLWKVKSPFNVSVAALKAAEASLDDLEYLHMTINRIRNEQRRLRRRLDGLDFVKTYPSATNFILCEMIGIDAHDVHQRLADRGIMVRGYGDSELRNFLRISVGRAEDTNRLITALQTIGSNV